MLRTKSQTYDARMVGWLSLAQMISWGTMFYSFSLLMEPLERELGMGRAQSSLAFSGALLTEGLLGWMIGRRIDRGQGRAVMCCGSALAAAGLGLLGLVRSPAEFLLVWVLLGAAMACALYNPAFAIVTHRFPQDFRRAIITLTFLGGLASTVFIPLIAWLISHFGWRHTVMLLALLHLLICLPVHWHWLRGDATLQGPTKSNATRIGNLRSISRPWAQPSFLLIGVFITLMMGVTAALPAHMVSLLREQGISERWVLGIPALIGVLQVLGRLALYFFEHLFDMHASNRWIPALIPAGLALLLAAGTLGTSGEARLFCALAFAALYGMGNGMLTIVKGTAIALYVDSQQVAALNGLVAAPAALARALAPLALGALWTAQTGYRVGLEWLLLASVLAIAALIGAQKKATEPQRGPLR